MPGRPKYPQNSLKDITPSLFESISSSCRPWAAANGISSSNRGFISRGVREPLKLTSRFLNSCRSMPSNSSLRDRMQAAANSRYSHELSPFTSSAAAAFLAEILSIPKLCSAATTSHRSRTPLLSVSNFEKTRANLLMPSHPAASFRQKALCIGLLSRHVCTASHRLSMSVDVSWQSLTISHWCLRHSTAVGLAPSLKVSNCRLKHFASLLEDIIIQLGPFRCRSSHFVRCFAASVTPPEMSKGNLLVKSSYRTHPMLQTSLLGPQLPIHTSGAMVAGVPATLVPRMPKMPRQHTSAMPRSHTTTCGSKSNTLPSGPHSVL
mmetsp:Transcript_48361/g.138134  ORF Transcript_48361/g.138134 Transcript_48361/m.138134 type:complete len:321 (-) Transcript_48361:576-1538(-)